MCPKVRNKAALENKAASVCVCYSLSYTSFTLSSRGLQGDALCSGTIGLVAGSITADVGAS
jgi:hypothetical protein